MADEQRPPKKAVKRVVKKTVVRPPGTGSASGSGRSGRPGGTKLRVASPKRPPQRPGAQVGARLGGAGKALSARGSSVVSRTAGTTRSATRALGSAVAGRTRAVRDWRIPRLPALPAALITGAVVGLVTVGLTLAALALFSELRGVSSGGGRWGTLTFVVVAFVAFVLGELLLSAFGSAQPRLISFLGVVLTIVAILALFLEIAETRWALILVPATAAITYAVAHWLLDLAENSPKQLD